MANRGDHYERAFESHLRSLRVGILAVDESRRAFPEATAKKSIKNLDFVVTPSEGRLLLVDVKGRRVSSQRRTLENWTTRDDVDSLGKWEKIFGENSAAMLVFVYHLPSDADKARFHDNFSFADRHYGCLAISLTDYRQHMRVRSQKWKTVSIPKAEFDRYAKPFSSWL